MATDPDLKANGATSTSKIHFDISLLSPPLTYSPKQKPDLTADQLLKLREIEEHFTSGRYAIPHSAAVSPEAIVNGDASKPDTATATEPNEDKSAGTTVNAQAGDASSSQEGLTEREMMFLSRDTFERFLTATKGDVKAAIKRLEECIAWRRSVNIDDVQAIADDCEPESRTGKNIVMGFTPGCVPVMYFFPNRNTTPVEQRRIIHPIFLMERARDLAPAGVNGVVVVFNFTGKRQGPPSSISNARQLLHILGAHYPETLTLSCFQNMPWVVRMFINLMWPFVDPVTKKKVKFGSAEGQELVKDGDMEGSQLLKECGGDLDLPYNHEEYWNPMVKKCLEVREAQEEAFRALGQPRVGIEESLWRRPPPSKAGTTTGEILPAQMHLPSGIGGLLPSSGDRVI